MPVIRIITGAMNLPQKQPMEKAYWWMKDSNNQAVTGFELPFLIIQYAENKIALNRTVAIRLTA